MASVLKLLLASLAFARAGNCPWTHAWEWQGIFHVHFGGTLTWFAQKVNGQYADPHMTCYLHSASAFSEAGLEAGQATAAAAFSGNTFTNVTTEILSPDNAYRLHFDSGVGVTVFKIQAPPETELAVYCQHDPAEFAPAGEFSLIMENGRNLKPAYPVAEWTACVQDVSTFTGTTDLAGEVVAASFLTTLPTLVGIGILLFTCQGVGEWVHVFMHYANAGASGVIFACALFLLMPESYLLLMGGKSEGGAAAAWGSAVLAGWLIGAIIHHLGHFMQRREELRVQEAGDAEKKRLASWATALPVFWGDFLHNFSDGLVLGFAFYACNSAFAWKLCGGIIAHELPQELADFYVLVNKAGLKWYTALALNFVSGLSSMVGALMAYYMDVDGDVKGACLAVGAGTYLYVALTELGPGAAEGFKDSSRPVLSALLTVLFWIIGTVLLGLVLLDHEHCYIPIPVGETGAAEDPHAGHAH